MARVWDLAVLRKLSVDDQFWAFQPLVPRQNPSASPHSSASWEG